MNYPTPYLLFWIALFPGWVQAQIYTPQSYYYEGALNGETVALLLKQSGDQTYGLIHWPERGHTLRLIPSDEAGRLREKTLFTNQPTEGHWVLPAPGPASLRAERSASGIGQTITLQKQSRPVRPEDMERLNGSEEAVFFQLCRDFTGIRYDMIDYGGSAQRAPIRFRPEDVAFRSSTINLFGSSQEEMVLELRVSDYLQVLRVFERESQQAWRIMPEAVLVKRSSRDAEPCLTDPPGPAYLHYEFEELRKSGEWAISAYTYDGLCNYLKRGDDIYYYLWQVTADGFRTLYEGPARSYWYTSPDPAPVREPIWQSFSFVAGQATPFPRILRKRSAVYPWPQGVVAGEMLQPVAFQTEYIPLFPEIRPAQN